LFQFQNINAIGCQRAQIATANLVSVNENGSGYSQKSISTHPEPMQFKVLKILLGKHVLESSYHLIPGWSTNPLVQNLSIPTENKDLWLVTETQYILEGVIRGIIDIQVYKIDAVVIFKL
jgi:hypothetical protein